MSVSIIILNYNTKELLEKCLNSVFQKGWKRKFEVCVVDNASSDGSVEIVKKNFTQVKLLVSENNLGFTGGNNIGIKKSSSDLLILLNSDTEVLDGSLDNLIDSCENSDFGIMSCKLLNNDLTFQANAGDLPFGWSVFNWISGLDDIPVLGKYLSSFHINRQEFYKGTKEVGWISGSVMAIKRQVVDKIGYLDEGIFMYGEDVEYCLRAQRAGFKVGWTDQAQIIHLGGGSSDDPKFRQWLGELKGLLYIYKKYYGLLAKVLLKLVLYPFVILRILAFLVVGNFQFSKTYAKILINI